MELGILLLVSEGASENSCMQVSVNNGLMYLRLPYPIMLLCAFALQSR